MLQSFLHVAREPHQWLPQAFDWLEDKENAQLDPDSFITELEKNHHAPSLPDSSENMSYGNVEYYWFYRLDYELWKEWANNAGNLGIWSESFRKNDDIEKLIKGFRFRHCNSVEHIYPQHGEWKSNVSDELKHAFGNLALLARATNSKFSNSPCDAKRKWILDDQKTESLKMLHYLWMEKEDSARIEEHGTIMWDLLCRRRL